MNNIIMEIKWINRKRKKYLIKYNKIKIFKEIKVKFNKILDKSILDRLKIKKLKIKINLIKILFKDNLKD